MRSVALSKTSVQQIYSPPQLNFTDLRKGKQNSLLIASQSNFFVGNTSPRMNVTVFEQGTPMNVNGGLNHSTFRGVKNKYRTMGMNTPIKDSQKKQLHHQESDANQNQSLHQQSNFLRRSTNKIDLKQQQAANVPKTFKDWRSIQVQHKQERLAKMIPSELLDKERRQRLKNIESKIRADALVDKTKTGDELEDALKNKLSRLKQINISEEPFTYSLQKVHDRSFISKMLPMIQKQQIKHSPCGASHSKSPNLLRNTFSVEMYSEFLKYKYENKQKKENIYSVKNTPKNEEQNTSSKLEANKTDNIKITVNHSESRKLSPHGATTTNSAIKFPNLKASSGSNLLQSGSRTGKEFLSKSAFGAMHSTQSSNPLMNAVGLSFREKMQKMMEIRKEEEKRQVMMEELKKKKHAQKGITFDANFFEALEQKDMDNHLVEIIMFEINKLFMKEMLKYRGVTSEYNAMLKRKNLLEAKLFKKRYEKVQKHLNGNHNLENNLNPFKRPYQPSIFNEKVADKMEIPLNKELYDNVIKEAFSDLINNSKDAQEQEEDLKTLSDKEIINRIKQKFRQKVMEKGPSILTSDLGKGSFMEQMIKLCNYSKIAQKIQGGMIKYDKVTLKRNRHMTQPVTPLRVDDEDLNDFEHSKSSNFFITQPSSFPFVSNSQNVTPKASKRNFLTDNFSSLNKQQSPPRLTTYLNFLNSSRLGTNKNEESTTVQTGFTVRIKSNLRKESAKRDREGTPVKTNLMSQIIEEVNKDIQIKESIKERAKARTLSQDDWQHIGKKRILQFTILDRIIEDCKDYQQQDKSDIAKSLLGISPKKSKNILINSLDNSNSKSKTKLLETTKRNKQDMEDTLTFLERLKYHNKLSEVQNLRFNEQ